MIWILQPDITASLISLVYCIQILQISNFTNIEPPSEHLDNWSTEDFIEGGKKFFADQF